MPVFAVTKSKYVVINRFINKLQFNKCIAFQVISFTHDIEICTYMSVLHCQNIKFIFN